MNYFLPNKYLIGVNKFQYKYKYTRKSFEFRQALENVYLLHQDNLQNTFDRSTFDKKITNVSLSKDKKYDSQENYFLKIPMKTIRTYQKH